VVQDNPELVAPARVRVWRTPLSWFRSGCDWLVMLSPERADQYRILSELHGGISPTTKRTSAIWRRSSRSPFQEATYFAGLRKAGVPEE
jgi:hypothetical protein